MSNKKRNLLNSNKPGLFSPKFDRDEQLSFFRNQEVTFSEMKNTNIESTSSFRYADKQGLISTQQLNFDGSLFQNHTFFHSAVGKVNEAFNLIFNKYPYDGTNKKIEKFEDDLTQFEKYVLDSLPDSLGALVLSGTRVGEVTGGNFLSIQDLGGVAYSSISSKNDGKTYLSPKKNPFSFDFHLKIPKITNDNQIVYQKKEKNKIANNITIALSKSNSSEKCKIIAGITSGSNCLFVSSSLEKGKFNHIGLVYDKNKDRKLKLYINANISPTVTSSNAINFKTLEYSGNSSLIGSGSSIRLDHKIFTPKQTLSASIDEFRYYSSGLSGEKIKNIRRKSLDTKQDRKGIELYFKFNEPVGTYEGSDIVLDSSGNNLHSKIENYTVACRNSDNYSDNPIFGEDAKRNPVLFPAHPDVVLLATKLMTSASSYDAINPNTITKLIPPHYFLLEQEENQFNTILGELSDAPSSSGLPSAYNTKNIQILTSFLLVWGKFFDEIKSFIDAFSNIKNNNYLDYNNTPPRLLSEVAEIYGIKIPSFFQNANIDQLFSGLDFSKNTSKSTLALIDIQNIIWKRILADFRNIKKKKGTLQSLKSIFRSAGIEPDNLMTFREYGGRHIYNIESSRELKKDKIRLVNFSGSINNNYFTPTLDSQGRANTIIPSMISNFLSASRVEPGIPKIAGTFVSNAKDSGRLISNNISDGLLTTSSFTYQAKYSFNNLDNNYNQQSLIRIHTTGSDAISAKESVITNLVYDNSQKKLSLFIKDSTTNTTSNNYKEIFLSGSTLNLFNNAVWNVSFGRTVSENLKNISSCSYFLSANEQSKDKNKASYYTASFAKHSNESVFSNRSAQYNASGSFLCIGSQSLEKNSSGRWLNNTSVEKVKSTNFNGLVGHFKFWSKSLFQHEIDEHVRNPHSVGVKNPLTNYLFTRESGSFEKLRVNVEKNQPSSSISSEGKVTIYDYSQNNIHFSGKGFEPNSKTFKINHLLFDTLTSNFDLSIAKEKVRVRSFKEIDNVNDNHFAQVAPIFEVRPNEEVVDDPRFGIEMSVMKGLNENIMSIFSDYSFFEKALGRPNNLFEDRYNDIEDMRKVYFENLIEDLNLERYRNVFKWINSTFENLMFQLIPFTTKFLGIDFIYEQHVLERSRMRYYFDQIYTKHIERNPCRDQPCINIDKTEPVVDPVDPKPDGYDTSAAISKY